MTSLPQPGRAIGAVGTTPKQAVGGTAATTPSTIVEGIRRVGLGRAYPSVARASATLECLMRNDARDTSGDAEAPAGVVDRLVPRKRVTDTVL